MRILGMPRCFQRQMPMVLTVADARGDFTVAGLGHARCCQRQVPMVQTVQKPLEMPQLHFIDKFVGIPVLLKVQTSRRRRSFPQLQYIHKVVDVLVVLVELVPQVQAVKKTVEIPNLQIVKKVVEIHEIQAVQGSRTPESFGF